MNAAEAARSAWRDVWANKVRSSLSFAAISVGVASLLYTTAQTRGMQLELRKNLEVMGPGRMTVEKARDYVSRGLSPGLTLSDLRAVRAEIPGLYMADASLSAWPDLLVYGRTVVKRPRVQGVTEQWRRRDWVFGLRGRFFDSRDVDDAARVCVLLEPGGWVHKPFWATFMRRDGDFDRLVTHHDLLGREVRIHNTVFVVVGILKKPPFDKDPRWNAWNDPDVLVPITAAQRYLPGGKGPSDAVEKLRLDTGDERTIPDVRRRLEGLLTRRHRGEADFKIRDEREEIAGQMNDLKKYVKAGLALGIVALLAGGIGIMNVTLATIFLRVKEIGIRRAVGAGKGDILAQFLFEAVYLGMAGGVAGLGLAAEGIKLLEKLGERNVAAITWYQCAAMVALGALVSAAFAFFPAYQAAGLDPVEALRSE